MSLESAKAFIERMNSDKEFAKKMFACKDAEAQKAFIEGTGYSFTRDELNQLTELCDEQLESVAGGWTFNSYVCCGPLGT